MFVVSATLSDLVRKLSAHDCRVNKLPRDDDTRVVTYGETISISAVYRQAEMLAGQNQQRKCVQSRLTLSSLLGLCSLKTPHRPQNILSSGSFYS
jgi:hypothetical protein